VSYQGKGYDAMMILKNEVLARTLLRRTKEQCADDLALPPRQTRLRKLPFDAKEEDFYQASLKPIYKHAKHSNNHV
jgi:DNA repair protein RAD16